MKIGILTQPLQNNYGGLLQNYALQQVLKRMGHEVETLDWEPVKEGALKEWVWQRKNLIFSYFKKQTEHSNYQLNKKEQAVVGQFTRQFVNKYIDVCDYFSHNPKDFLIVDKKKEYDAYIVGSDQVWRERYNHGMIPTMFLNFVIRNNIKRIAYAASFGTSSWEYSPELTNECKELAKKFDLLTVREISGEELCKDNLGVEAINVLDPTLLLCKEDYERIVKAEGEPQSRGSLFHYILDPSPDKKKIIESVASELGLAPFTIMPKFQKENRTRENVKKNIDDCIFPSVTAWLRGFMDANVTIVDSFHGAVFSIIFNKPFWVIGNSKRGNARFESLLGMFELEDRMITPGETVDWNRAIDWGRVNDKREMEKERCIDLLKKSL